MSRTHQRARLLLLAALSLGLSVPVQANVPTSGVYRLVGTGSANALFSGPGCSGVLKSGMVKASEISFDSPAVGFFEFAGGFVGTLNFSNLVIQASGLISGPSGSVKGKIDEAATDLAPFSGAFQSGGIFSNDPLPEPLPTLVVDNAQITGVEGAGPMGGPCNITVNIISASYALISEEKLEGVDEGSSTDKASAQLNSTVAARSNVGLIRRNGLGKRFARGSSGGETSADSGGFTLTDIGAGRASFRGQSAGDGFAYPWGVWAAYEHSDYEDNFAATAFEAGRDAVLVGADFSPWDSIVFGVAVGYESTDLDSSFNRGGQDLDGFTVAPYLGAQVFDGVWVDALFAYSGIDIDQFRTDPVTGARVTSSTDSDRWAVAGNLNFGKEYDGVYFVGTAGLLVARDDIDGFTESDATVVAGTRTQLAQLRLGASASYAWEISLGTLEPFLGAMYEHDFERDDVVTATAVQPANDEDDVLFSAGMRMFGDNGFSGSFEYSTVLGREDFESDSYSVLVRWEF